MYIYRHTHTQAYIQEYTHHTEAHVHTQFFLRKENCAGRMAQQVVLPHGPDELDSLPDSTDGRKEQTGELFSNLHRHTHMHINTQNTYLIKYNFTAS